MANPNITLTIKSTAGQIDETFNPANPGQRILDVAKRELKLVATGSWVVKHNGQILDLSVKIRELGLRDGDTVHVQEIQPQDG